MAAEASGHAADLNQAVVFLLETYKHTRLHASFIASSSNERERQAPVGGRPCSHLNRLTGMGASKRRKECSSLVLLEQEH